MAKAHGSLPSADRLLPSRLVGRETELTHLHGWLAKALSGERQLVFVTGEPEIGKTTKDLQEAQALLAELET